MKEELPNEKLREAEDMEIDIKELLFKCLIHWPWFVGTVVACLIAAYVYLYVATPVYNISATVLIKDDKKGGASNNVGGLDELGLSGLITSSQSIDNEIEVLAHSFPRRIRSSAKILFFAYFERKTPSTNGKRPWIEIHSLPFEYFGKLIRKPPLQRSDRTRILHRNVPGIGDGQRRTAGLGINIQRKDIPGRREERSDESDLPTVGALLLEGLLGIGNRVVEYRQIIRHHRTLDVRQENIEFSVPILQSEIRIGNQVLRSGRHNTHTVGYELKIARCNQRIDIAFVFSLTLRTPLLARLPLLLLGTQFLVLTLCLCAYPVTCEAKNGNECQCENLFHNAKRFCIMKLQNPCLKSQFL